MSVRDQMEKLLDECEPCRAAELLRQEQEKSKEWKPGQQYEPGMSLPDGYALAYGKYPYRKDGSYKKLEPHAARAGTSEFASAIAEPLRKAMEKELGVELRPDGVSPGAVSFRGKDGTSYKVSGRPATGGEKAYVTLKTHKFGRDGKDLWTDYQVTVPAKDTEDLFDPEKAPAIAVAAVKKALNAPPGKNDRVDRTRSSEHSYRYVEDDVTAIDDARRLAGLTSAYPDRKLSEDWGSSDQYAMNQSMHRELGKPKSPPTLSRVLDAAEGAVEFYWRDWPEMRSDRKGLINKAARYYYRAFFPDFFEAMEKLFGEGEELPVGFDELLGEGKGKTFAQAKDELLKGLAADGWKVKTDLKVPHATSPDGTRRLYFKTQAVYLSKDDTLGASKHDFGSARSVHLDDTRKMDYASFAKEVARWTGADHFKSIKAAPKPATPAPAAAAPAAPAAKADAPSAPMNPDQYRRQHGKCPEGYHFDDASGRCVKAKAEATDRMAEMRRLAGIEAYPDRALSDDRADLWHPDKDVKNPGWKTDKPAAKAAPADKQATFLKMLKCGPGKEAKMVYGKPSCVPISKA